MAETPGGRDGVSPNHALDPIGPRCVTSTFEGRVDIGGRSLHATVRGAGPTVVLNSGGGVAGVGDWAPIEGELAGLATVVCYDRAGLGRSDAAPSPPAAADMVADLRALLRALALDAPALLVGASLSGLMAQLYACMHPAEVSGLLLLDPTPDAAFARFASHPVELKETIREAMLDNAARLGMSEQGLAEIRRLPESAMQLADALAASGAPDVPVIVVTARLPPRIASGKAKVDLTKVDLGAAHASLVARYARGRHVLAERSSHQSIVSNEPGLVVDAVRTLLDSAAPR